MRKASFIIISLLILSILFVGCEKNGAPSADVLSTDGLTTDELTTGELTTDGIATDGLSIKICGYSDSIPENPHKLEYEDWSKGYFVDPKAEKNVTISVRSIEVAGEYIKTEKRFAECYETHRYKDEKNRYFSLTDDGKLCAYFFGSSSSESNEQTLTESECIDIAKTFVSDITDVSTYTVTSTFDKDSRMYTVSFTKYADGFKCSDRADIMIEETGYIYSFSSTMLGRISSDAVTSFDRKVVQEQIISKLDAEYSKAKQVYDDVTYEKFDYELTIDENGEYALICSIDVNCVHHYDDCDSILSERIILLIQ